MKTAIIYGTKHGGTTQLVELLQKSLPDEVTVYALKDGPKIVLERFDTVIIGGSIHAGGIQKEIKTFCHLNESKLLSKKVGLFICSSMQETTEFAHNFSEKLLSASLVHMNLGYKNNIENFNFLEKVIMKIVPKDSIKPEGFSQERVEEFVGKILA